MRTVYRQNVGGLDRQLRFVIGVAISIIFIAPVLNFAMWVRVVALIISGYLVFSSVAGYCLLYDSLGWSSRRP